jgi:uncharacterized protein
LRRGLAQKLFPQISANPDGTDESPVEWQMRHLLQITFLLLIWLACPATQGASFDCGQSRSVYERRICADPHLSRLDETLARAYELALAGSNDPTRERKAQARWLIEVRDRCESVPCLQAAYEARLSRLQPLRSPETRCPISEADLVGAWQRRSAGGFFEEMAFTMEGSTREFSSWLHHRPEIAGGAWSFKDCTIRIQHPSSETMRFTLQVIGYRHRQLRVRDLGDHAVWTYRRLGK